MDFPTILKKGEGTTVEFKEVMNENGYKTLSAFSNTEGGLLLLGISDDGDIVGCDCSDEPVRSIANKIMGKMGIHPTINILESDEHNILIIEVGKSDIPIAYNGKYYKRVGTTTTGILGDELKEFFLLGSNWDGLSNDYSLQEIDEISVMKFVKSAVNAGRMPADDSSDILEILLKLNLLVDGKLTNAALILFGKDPQKYFTNALIRVTKFKDDVSISDRRIKGNLFNQVVEAEEAIKNLIHVEYEIKDEFARKDIWDYPLDAIREVLLNSIVHRDYFKFVVQTQIKISEDQIWFFNPGGLLGGLTIEELKKPHPSQTRNPLIADIFSKAGLVEVYGSGIGNVLNSLKKAGLPEPDFKEEFGGFSVYMFKGYTENMLKEMGLNERQIIVMDYLSKKRSISTKEYSEIIPEMSIGTLRRDLADLVKKNLVKKVGPQQSRRYELVK